MKTMPPLPYFSEDGNNRRFQHEQEGIGRILSHAGNEIPRCCSELVGIPAGTKDYRGPSPAGDETAPTGGHKKRINYIEWETPPSSEDGESVFCFIASSQVIPEYRPAYPPVTATLTINDKTSFYIPLGVSHAYRIQQEGIGLYFDPRRMKSLTEGGARFLEMEGICGVYRLVIPSGVSQKGLPVKLRIELDEAQTDVMTSFWLSPRRDVLSLSLNTLRNEVAQLQSDMVDLKLAFSMLSARQYPELFKNMLKAERGIAVLEETAHMHPPTLCKYDGDSILLTFRRGTDHLTCDGAAWAVRSFDKGRTWTKPEKLFDLGNSDHRSTPLLQISNGDIVGTDYRCGAHYNADGIWLSHTQDTYASPSMWGVWSEDRGKTWNFTRESFAVPGSGLMYCEAERPLIELPDGGLLMACMYRHHCDDASGSPVYAMSLWHSGTGGRIWKYLSSTEPYDEVACPHLEGEPALIGCKSGKLVMLMRSEAGATHRVTDWWKKGMVLQCESYDNGKRWTKLHPTDMCSMSTPAHLTLLQDGRLLATHASRGYPGAIYLTLSDDEGKTWNTHATKIVTQDLRCFDSTYPTTVQFSDGSLLTVWYADRFGRFHIATARYDLEALL